MAAREPLRQQRPRRPGAGRCVFGSAFESTRRGAELARRRRARRRRRGRPSTRIRSTGASGADLGARLARRRRPSPRSAGRCRRARSPTGGSRRRPASEAWSWSRTKAVPGVDGPPVESLIACQPSAARTCSDSKHSRQVLGGRGAEHVEGVGDPRAVAGRRAPRPREPAELARAQGAGSGGVVSNSGVISAGDLRRARPRSAGSARASAGGEAPHLVAGSRARSSSRCSAEPSANRLSAGPGRVDLDPALDQAQVPPDRLAQHAQHVGAGRGAEAGRELLGDAAAADDLAALAAPPCAGRRRAR